MSYAKPCRATLWFEAGQNESERIGTWEVRPWDTAHDNVIVVPWRRSFGQLRLVLENSGKWARVLVDGKQLKLASIEGAASCRIELKFDLEFHRITIFTHPRKALIIDVSVEHTYITKIAGSHARVVKWTWGEYQHLLEKYRDEAKDTSQSLRTISSVNCGARAGTSPHEDPPLTQLILRFARAISASTSAELSVDFPNISDYGVSIERITSSIKGDPRCVSESLNGPIRYNGKRYTTSLSHGEPTRTGRPNLDVLREFLVLIRKLLRKTAANDLDCLLITDTLTMLSERFGASEDNVGSLRFLELPVRSGIGRALQDHGYLVFFATRLTLQMQSRHAGLQWLQGAPRDFELFERLVFSACASALDMQPEGIASPSGVLRQNAAELLNVNTPEGASRFAKVIEGWRHRSKAPSGYLPDICYIEAPRNFAIIDAKFRIVPGDAGTAKPSAVKEVQAYLDEFGLLGAVIAIPSQHVLGAGTTGSIREDISGLDANGRKRLISVVAIDTKDMPAANALLAGAIRDVIALH